MEVSPFLCVEIESASLNVDVEGPGPEDDLKRDVAGLLCSPSGQSVVSLELLLTLAIDADL